MIMNRREFLSRLMTVPVTTSLFLTGSSSLRNLGKAFASTGKTLVVIFQRGGCDGLNTVVPYGDLNYVKLRPNLAIAPPDSGKGGEALDLDGFFGLHPSLAPLHTIYHLPESPMAIFPTVHYSDASRSHFDGEIYIESGSSYGYGAQDGWLNRHLTSLAGEGQLRAVAFRFGLPHSLKGEANVSTFTDLSDLGLEGSEASKDFATRLRTIFSQSIDPEDTNRAALHASGLTILDNIDSLGTIDTQNYQPENGAVYPEGTYGRQMRQTAQLIKEGVGLEVVTIDLLGWDTHSNQGGAEPDGAHSRKHAEFAQGISALYNDLGQLMDDVIILTMTEFGRTVKENASKGTDHGHASAWFAIGGGIRGGIYGDWPGLSPTQLYLGRYLDHTVDFRDVMAEVLTRHLLNSDLETVLPGHTYSPIGFL